MAQQTIFTIILSVWAAAIVLAVAHGLLRRR
jgi:hypothetical protein